MSTHKTVAERNRNTVRSRRSVSDNRFEEKKFFDRFKDEKRGSTCIGRTQKKVSKGARGMPRLLEAKKDVLSCEKLRGLAKTN